MTRFYVLQKPKRKGDPKVLEMVRNQRCSACGSWPSDAHHVTTKGAGGGDTGDNVMPLCRTHHTEWHQSGPGKMISKYPGVLRWLEEHERMDVIFRARKDLDVVFEDEIDQLNYEFLKRNKRDQIP